MRVTKVVEVQVPFSEVLPGQYHDDDCGWNDEDGCERCSEELDAAYEWAARQVETDKLKALDQMLTNRPDGFTGESSEDNYWEIEVSLGRAVSR